MKDNFRDILKTGIKEDDETVNELTAVALIAVHQLLGGKT